MIWAGTTTSHGLICRNDVMILGNHTKAKLSFYSKENESTRLVVFPWHQEMPISASTNCFEWLSITGLTKCIQSDWRIDEMHSIKNDYRFKRMLGQLTRIRWPSQEEVRWFDGLNSWPACVMKIKTRSQ